jgi:hypothetical protein
MKLVTSLLLALTVAASALGGTGCALQPGDANDEETLASEVGLTRAGAAALEDAPPSEQPGEEVSSGPWPQPWTDPRATSERKGGPNTPPGGPCEVQSAQVSLTPGASAQ